MLPAQRSGQYSRGRGGCQSGAAVASRQALHRKNPPGGHPGDSLLPGRPHRPAGVTGLASFAGRAQRSRSYRPALLSDRNSANAARLTT
jgi:hypothetical protein